MTRPPPKSPPSPYTAPFGYEAVAGRDRRGARLGDADRGRVAAAGVVDVTAVGRGHGVRPEAHLNARQAQHRAAGVSARAADHGRAAGVSAAVVDEAVAGRDR